MTVFSLADRLSTLPPYLFAAIDKAKAQVAAKGMDIISLGIGDPDLPTPEFIIKALYNSAKNPRNHQYPSYIGMKTYRQAVADWYKQRFDVDLDPDSEVVSLIGSKEGIAHFPLAFINPGDMALVATPNYPVYGIATNFAGGEVQYLPLLEENDFLVDLDAVSNDTWAKAKMIFVCYPNNPTAATATREFYERLIEKAREFNVIVVSDAAYTEIYYNPDDRPMSILECKGAKDVCIEFHSLSKTYNMTGWRIGMAVGNPSLVAGLGKIKENCDSGIFQAVQEAGIAALRDGEPYAEQFRAIYKERRDVVSAALTKAGIRHRIPDASFYMWCNTPEGYKSSEFVTNVLMQTGVVLTPGNGFGTPGEGYFRISLTVNNDKLEGGGIQNIETVICYVSLGSNEGNPEENLNEALTRLETYGDEISLKAISNIYLTEPQGKIKDQPWFANQMIKLEIDAEIWAAAGFLSTCTAIEAQLGRNRQVPGGPRPLDMDIIAWGDVVMDTDFLTLPHPRARERAFVLVPLKEIAPDFVFPDGTTVDEALTDIRYRLDGNRIWQDS